VKTHDAGHTVGLLNLQIIAIQPSDRHHNHSVALWPETKG